MAAPSLQEIFDNNRYQLKYAAVMSTAWFNQQAAYLRRQGITSLRALKDNDDLKWSMEVVPGKLYMYMYNAKHKDTLPYWDMFPLVFPFRKTPDGKGFYGLNMHYIPYQYRIKILDSLIDIDLSKKTDNKKLQLSWNLISNASKLKPLEACVHMYLHNHVMSAFKLIYPKDWATAMLLPTAKFVGATQTHVWAESKKKAGY